MSYDIQLVCSHCNNTLSLDEEFKYAHGGGTWHCDTNFTYNYSSYYYKEIDAEKGIRAIYGLTGQEALPLLENAIKVLGTTIDEDGWKNTPGNAGNALLTLIAFAKKHPQGIFQGD